MRGRNNIRRTKKRQFNSWQIFLVLIIVLLAISISYAMFSTQLIINGGVDGEQEQLDIVYLNIDNTSSYPSSIGYMETYSYTFSIPPTIEAITMGGTRLTLGTDYTYTDGVLRIPNVTGNLVINGEEPELEDFKIKYIFGDNIEFDGKTLLDTDIALFSEENFDRNFELTVNIDSNTFDSTQNNKLNTVLNCVDHKTSPYHGFLLRRDASKYIFKVTNANNGVTERHPSLGEVQNVLITRTNKKIYADLTNGSNLTEVGDFSNFTQRINSTLFIGSDINSSNVPFRCFLGEMSNITVTNYYEAEEAPITLPKPTRTGYIFSGWFSNSNFTTRVGYGGETYMPKGDTNLYAKWTKEVPIEDDVDEYIHNGQINFAQEDYINTHVYLYSQKNIHRNFEMSFDIVGLGNSSNDDTLMSATKNIFSIANASNETMNLYTTGKTAGNSVEGIPNTITNVRLIRIDDKLYYSLNGQTFLKINDYAGVTSYSNRPVLFGADFKPDGSVYRNFDGILSNMKVKFISDNVTLADYDRTHGQLATVYQHNGDYVFDGTNNIDKNIRPFDFDSYDKDFEISFNIVSIDSTTVEQSTLVNSKYENSDAGFPGFVYRLTTNKKQLELTAAKATSGSPILKNVSDVQSVKISRRNMKLYLKINDEEEQLAYDFSGFKDFFSTKITIGSSTNANGNIFRPFKGTLSDIVIKMEQ